MAVDAGGSDPRFLEKTGRELGEKVERLKRQFADVVPSISLLLKNPALKNSDHARRTVELLNALVTACSELTEMTPTYADNVAKAKNAFIGKREHRRAKGFVVRANRQIHTLRERLEELHSDIQHAFGTKWWSEKEKKTVRNVPLLVKEITGLLQEADVLVQDAAGRLQLTLRLLPSFENIEKSKISLADLRTGDILLAFATKDFLKEEFKTDRGSNIGHLATVLGTQSRIVHSMLFLLENGRPMYIDAFKDSGGVTMKSLESAEDIRKVVPPGKVLVVMRPRASEEMLKKVAYEARSLEHSWTKFSTKKAAGVGLSMFVSRFIHSVTGGYVHTPNAYGNTQDVLFCSEFVDVAFKNAGFLLTPHSVLSSTVAPSDFLRSPKLDYVGLIFDEEDMKSGAMDEHVEEMKRASL